MLKIMYISICLFSFLFSLTVGLIMHPARPRHLCQLRSFMRQRLPGVITFISFWEANLDQIMNPQALLFNLIKYRYYQCHFANFLLKLPIRFSMKLCPGSNRLSPSHFRMPFSHCTGVSQLQS